MAEFSFVELEKELDEVRETGVSFQGKSQKWENEKEVKSLVEEINNCTSLLYLNLEGNTLGVEAARTIGKALENHPEFKKALWKDLFTGRLKTEIPDALRYLGSGIIKSGANLTVLDCSDNALGPNGMTGLMELLSSSACYGLQELKLNNCGLGIAGGKMLAKALLECHQNSVKDGRPLQLKVFIAGRNRLENEGAKALSKVFEKIQTLEEICMPQNGIYYDGITALSEGFKVNKNMRILNLNDNTIRAKGAASLAEAFTHMQKLREINFGDCLLKTKGALLLANALQNTHQDLEVINFGYNEIGVDGGIAVASAMQNKHKIRSIILDGNQFGDDGCEQVKEIIQGCSNANALGSLLEDEGGDEDNEIDDDNDNDDDENNESDNAYQEEEEEEKEACNAENDKNEHHNGDDEAVNDTEEDDEEIDVNYVSMLTKKSLNTTSEQSFTSANSSISFVDEVQLPNTIETFCKTPHPTIKLFNAIEDNKIEAFREYLSSYQDDDYLILLIFTILKCSAISEESTDALNVAEGLYKDAFDYAEKTRQITRVKNFFLIQLGLLKSEDKTFKPAYNLKSCRYALNKTLANKPFADDIQQTFNIFLNRFA